MQPDPFVRRPATAQAAMSLATPIDAHDRPERPRIRRVRWFEGADARGALAERLAA